MTREGYINKYKFIAIREHFLRGVPASITLAQGIIESGNGNSELATKYNNHFGIKGTKETGVLFPTYEFENGQYVNVEQPFRVYKNAEESFKDHSKLLNSERYKPLHNYKRSFDWAYGLKSLGYATDPDYANKLVDVIQKNNLERFDLLGKNREIISLTLLGFIVILAIYFIKK